MLLTVFFSSSLVLFLRHFHKPPTPSPSTNMTKPKNENKKNSLHKADAAGTHVFTRSYYNLTTGTLSMWLAATRLLSYQVCADLWPAESSIMRFVCRYVNTSPTDANEQFLKHQHPSSVLQWKATLCCRREPSMSHPSRHPLPTATTRALTARRSSSQSKKMTQWRSMLQQRMLVGSACLVHLIDGGL
jgi:hypothetical protein